MTYFRKYSEIMPLTVSMKDESYQSSQADNSGYQPTVSELLSFARDSLKANYIFWTRHPDYYRDALQMLNMNAQEKTPSGGLDPTCLGVYSSCVN